MAGSYDSGEPSLGIVLVRLLGGSPSICLTPDVKPTHRQGTTPNAPNRPGSLTRNTAASDDLWSPRWRARPRRVPASHWVTFVRPLSHALHDRWQRFSEGRAALPVLFVWALAEATLWPIIPDAMLAPMALVRRTGRRRLAAACIAGMALGGVVTVLVAHAAPGFALDLLRDLPLVTKAQIEAAADGLHDHGAAGFLIQPVSGIPFKVWAVLAGVKDIGPALVIPLFIVARGARMLATTLVTGTIGHLLRRRLRDWFAVVAAIYVVGFAIVFYGVVV